MFGKIISHYEILKNHVDGGMGVVYIAVDTNRNGRLVQSEKREWF